MKKILKSYGLLAFSILVFLACSYWIITNINFNEILGKVGEAQSMSSEKSSQK